MKNTLLFLIALWSFACTRHEETTVEDRFQVIQSQIDRKNYQEAEEQLNAILKDEPGNEKARVILASVFVHKAGVTVKDYFTLEKLTRFESDEERRQRSDLVSVDNLEKLKIKPDSDLSKALSFIRQVNEAVGRAQEIVEKFNQIPVLTDESAENIYLALQELEKLETMATGNALYRGVIKLLYFRYLWEKRRFFNFGEGKFCSQSLQKLDRQLEVFQKYSSGMIRDLGNGFPKNKTQLDRAADDLNTNMASAQKWMGSFQGKKQSLKQVIESFVSDPSVPGFTCDF